jgi:excisionase family DNA binding protein
MEHQTEELLTRMELAARLKVAPKTIDRMTRRGELRVHRVGRAPRYAWAEVLADTAQATVQEKVRVALLPRRIR